METGIAALPEEDFQLEHLRNRLIREVPELRRGMLAEMMRPDASCWPRRSASGSAARSTTTSGCSPARRSAASRSWSRTTRSTVDADPRALIAEIVARTKRLDRILTLPEPE